MNNRLLTILAVMAAILLLSFSAALQAQVVLDTAFGDGPTVRTPVPDRITAGDYRVRVFYEPRLPDGHPPVGGLVIQTAPEQFLVAGFRFNWRFEATTPGTRRTEIERVELGRFDNQAKWALELWLNGDETGANYVARIPPSSVNEYLGARRPMILKVTVYRHD